MPKIKGIWNLNLFPHIFKKFYDMTTRHKQANMGYFKTLLCITNEKIVFPGFLLGK